MGLGDIFKATKNKALENRVAELESMLSPEQTELDSLRQSISMAKEQLSTLKNDIGVLEKEKATVDSEIKTAKEKLIETNDEVLMQSFALYTPQFQFTTSEKYKEELDIIRKKEKEMIRDGSAATGNMNWTVNGSSTQGKKMVKDMQKLLVRAFNSECDDCVDHVRFNNIDSMTKRIRTSCDAISKLGTVMSISISSTYLNLKIKELRLAFEYQQKKQEEKERLRQLRAEERERVKLEKEIEETRKKLEKEKKHYSNALEKLSAQLAVATEQELPALKEKKAELESQLGEIAHSIEQVDYRAANQKAGYVYVISNIGAFGEGIYKIGMTRRLEPMDRIDELGDASVPFDFDVHALIFSEDAPALEAALHRAFDARKVNMVNTRREFFRVSLDEIKKVVYENFDKTVEFVDIPPAEQYRESLILSKTANIKR